MLKIYTQEEFVSWVEERLKKRDHTPSSLVLMSYHIFDFSEYDKEERRFVKLKAVAEQTRTLFYQPSKGV